MAQPQWAPSVVVGIDFGMTCTGVAYSSFLEDLGWTKPEIIKRWPDHEDELFNKYPSRIAYDNNGHVVDWGPCDVSPNVAFSEREFKLYLDPAFEDPTGGGISHEAATRHYVNYMLKLHHHINDTLYQRLPDWQSRNVEYRFSIPTTWKSPRLTTQLKDYLAAAGFANKYNRRVVFSRTEAEAAAIYVAKEFKAGDIVMVVDAGGATTDLNALEIMMNKPEALQMRALDKAEGINVGSVLIDVAARELIKRRLQERHITTPVDLKWVAESMMQSSGFEYSKCNFDAARGSMDHYMEIPGQPGQHIILKSRELGHIFDSVIQDLVVSLREKILSLAERHPERQIQYLVLSGGLGSSQHVKNRLTAEIAGWDATVMNVTDVQIIVASEPQLAVVKGLVMDRSQALDQGAPVWIGRCSRVSFGVVCALPYDRQRHVGEPTVKDPLTGKLIVEEQIDWLIKEGDVIPEDGITRRYTLTLAKDDKFAPIFAHIVMSELRADNLPRSRYRGPVTKVCTVQGMFSPDDFSSEKMVTKTKKWFGQRQQHNVTQVDLRVIIGSTGLGFEMASPDGSRTYTEDTSKVEVIWHDYIPPAQQRRSVLLY